MEWFFFWVGVNFLIGYAIGRQKNLVAESVLLSVLLGPIGWILSGLLRGKLRRCPFCAEDVKAEAVLCKHCGKQLYQLVSLGSRLRNNQPPNSEALTRNKRVFSS